MKKRNEVDIESIIGFDALYESMQKCRKGVIWKDSVAAYSLRSIEKTTQLERQLHDGTYRHGAVKHFTITSPKRREIASIPFRDRVYQRSLNDNAVYPIMTRSFIYDNFACQKGKGTDPARERMKELLRRFYRKHGSKGYVSQFDIHGYYPNMDHKITEELFRKILPDEIYERVANILHEQYAGDTGYNPGSQLVQIAGISFLDDMDHYVKEQLHMKTYIRYMDDFIMVHEDAGILKDAQQKVKAYLAKKKLTLNEKKTRIYPISEGIPFLGFIFRLTTTGKVIMTVKPENVKAERRKIRRLVKKSTRTGIPRAHVDESYRAWRSHAMKGNNYKTIKRMDRYYKSLWEERSDDGSSQEKNDLGERTGED